MSDAYNSISPVAIIFFNRSDTLQKVFEAVREARPKKLFLIQDGPRNETDKQKILECRKVVEKIDWDCDVVEDYSDINLGCGSRVSSGITNAFKSVDRLIILEDDCVPSLGMFQFCDDVLEKYKDDQRINMISGMNHLGRVCIPNANYLFCKTGAIWGWATWKRVWDNYEYDMSFFKDRAIMEKFSNLRFPRYFINQLNKTGQMRYNSLTEGGKLTAWTYQFAMLRHLYSQLVIVPDRNLVTNIGLTDESTHGATSMKLLPKGLQQIFFIPSFEYEAPIMHPRYIIEDTKYDDEVWRIMGKNPLAAKYRKVESVMRRALFGDNKQRKKIIEKLVRNGKNKV